jgi:hypothetical protein
MKTERREIVLIRVGDEDKDYWLVDRGRKQIKTLAKAKEEALRIVAGTDALVRISFRTSSLLGPPSDLQKLFPGATLVKGPKRYGEYTLLWNPGPGAAEPKAKAKPIAKVRAAMKVNPAADDEADLREAKRNERHAAGLPAQHLV